MEELTQRQAEILQVIRDHIEDTGFPPTRAEIADILGFRSVNAAEDHLKALERKGAIEILPGTSRGIRLTQETGLPVIGNVAAGKPILAEQHIEAHYQLDSKLFKPRPHYLLRVRGMSMRDAGILDEDLLVVHRTKNAQNNQIVVARLGDEVTVKRFRRKWKNQVWLMPENPDFDTIVVDLREQELVIEGIGVGVVRRGLQV
jgi:repressor LexA